MRPPSAGILLYRISSGQVQVLLVHPGGPYFAQQDEGVWTIPKGEYGPDEEALVAAQREFLEETGFTARGPFRALTPFTQRNGKRVTAWAAAGDVDAALLRSNLFSMEWPPGSGKWQEFPEVDRGEWFAPEVARKKMIPAQVPLLDQLLAEL